MLTPRDIERDVEKYKEYLMSFNPESPNYDPSTKGFAPLSFKELFGYRIIIDDTSANNKK